MSGDGEHGGGGVQDEGDRLGYRTGARGAKARRREAGELGEAMRPGPPEPKGKLDAITGYSFTTLVCEDGQRTRPAVAG